MSLKIFTIYDHPKDYPTKFVVRLFIADQPTEITFTADSLNQARLYIPKGLVKFDRHHTDDPVIVESWL